MEEPSLAAEALFVLAFVNLPKLIVDTIVVGAFGFPPGPEIAGLLWAQVLLIAVVVLPVAAVAVMTSGFVQLFTAVFIVALANVGRSLIASQVDIGAPWIALEWTRLYAGGIVILVGNAGIVLRQYRRQGTAVSRMIGAAGVVAAFAVMAWFPWSSAFALQSRLSSEHISGSTVHVAYDTGFGWTTRAIVDREGDTELDIPLQITGIDKRFTSVPDGIIGTIEGAGGAVWHTENDPWKYVRASATHTSFHAIVKAAFYRQVRNEPVRIRGAFYQTLYGNPRQVKIPIAQGPTFVSTPGIGLCSAMQTGQGIMVSCRSALKSRTDIVDFEVLKERPAGPASSVQGLSYGRPLSYSPFPAEMSLIPVTQSTLYAPVFGKATGVSAYAVEPVSHVRTEFEIDGLRLADHEVHP